jgi:hypothetical protein
MKTQTNLMQNFPAVAASLLGNYYDPNHLTQLLGKIQTPNPFPNIAANNLFNSPMDMESILNNSSIPLNGSEMKIAEKPAAKTKGSQGERKSKKVSHSCPHCNFTTVMSQHMKSHLVGYL